MATEAVQTVTDWGIVTAVSAATTLLGALVTWVYTRGGKAAILEKQAADARDDLKVAQDRTDVIQKAYDSLLERLHEHMLTDAAAFAKLEALTAEATRNGAASEVRLTTAIEKLVERIDGMSSRFDTFITSIAPLIPKAPAA